MAVYYKPQSPIQSGEDFIYPITTADQVKVDKDTRLNAVGVYLKNIDNSTDTTVYGNNATTLGGVAAEDYALKTDTAPDSSKLGGVAASDYALKTDTAQDSSKLGGKAPEYYLQPRNLLDNSDFTNPVNQRGATSYTGIGYTIDRWRSWDNEFSLAVGAGGITVNGGNLVQYLEKKLSGIHTLVAMTSSGTLYIITGDIGGGGYYYNNIGFGTEPDRTSWVSLGGGTYVWAALYEGSYTADTLPPYVPKGYAAELAECQRYYLSVRGNWNIGIALAGMGNLVLDIPTNIKMIRTPNVILAAKTEAWHPGYSWFDISYNGIQWVAPVYRIMFTWKDSLASNISDLILVNGVIGLSADL